MNYKPAGERVSQLQCADCGSALTPEDIFRGTCGTAVSAANRGGAPRAEPVQVSTMAPGTAWAGTSARVPPASAARGEAGGTTWWQSRPEPVEVTPQDQFFGHAAAQPDGPLSNSTRYLCAAAYLNPDYANSVISELVASHRAVAPSLGIDLIPIIRHCLNARKAQLLRDVLLTVLLIAGLFLATAPIIAILVISFCLSFLPGVQWERRSLGIMVLVVFLILIGTALAGYSYSMYRTFSDQLRPGAMPGRFDRAPEEVEERIARVAAAQRGNMTIYGGDNPFIGTGPRLLNEAWSLAIELARAPGPGRSSSRPAHRSGSYVPIDPRRIAPRHQGAAAEGQGRRPAAERAHYGAQHARSCRRRRQLPVGQPGHRPGADNAVLTGQPGGDRRPDPSSGGRPALLPTGLRERRRPAGLGPPPRGHRQHRSGDRRIGLRLRRGRRAHVVPAIRPDRLAAYLPGIPSRRPAAEGEL